MHSPFVVPSAYRCHNKTKHAGLLPHQLLLLQALHDPLEEMEALAAASGIKGCAYCGGLGHRIADCPKLRSESKAQERSKKDYFGSGGFGGEM
jgi:ATP-dependent RNA helicase DDX41